MSSAPDDRAARARIRDAAIDLFSLEGFDVPLRRIAEHAGVSAALVIHHFGSKAGLREACDAHVLADYVTGKDLGQESMRNGSAMDVFAGLGRYGPLLGYLRHTIREGAEPARRIVEAMIADADARTPDAVDDGTLTPVADITARNRFLVLSMLSTVALYDLIDPERGAGTGTELMARMSDDVFLPMLEVYTHGYLRDTSIYDDFAASRAAAAGERAASPRRSPDSSSDSDSDSEPTDSREGDAP